MNLKKKLGIYVHIPFCESKCSYCNFVSFKSGDDVKENYVLALLKEMEMCKEEYADYTVNTIFIGGGTPSCLRSKAIKNIINAIMSNFSVETDAEITVEANPNSLTMEKLIEFKLAGVNRLSIGLQSLNNNLLKLIGRLHTVEDFCVCLKNARSVGFENINVDLLLGLPQQTLSDVKNELKFLVKEGIPHISAYGLIVENNTKIYRQIASKELVLPPEEKSVKMYDYTLKYLKKKGLLRYEVSNFAKRGFECRHNLKYWRLEDYVGFGVAAHSFVKNFRWQNTNNLKRYINLIEKGKRPECDREEETFTGLKEEFVMLSLRESQGIDLIKFEQSFGEDLLLTKQREIAKLLKNKLIKYRDNRIFATKKGFKMLNQIIIELA